MIGNAAAEDHALRDRALPADDLVHEVVGQDRDLCAGHLLRSRFAPLEVHEDLRVKERRPTVFETNRLAAEWTDKFHAAIIAQSDNR